MKIASKLLQLSVLGCLFVGVVGVRTAYADNIGFDLTTGNAGVSGFPGPYIHVDVNRTDATHAILTYTSLGNALYQYAMGSNGMVGASVNSTNFGLSGITENGLGTATAG